MMYRDVDYLKTEYIEKKRSLSNLAEEHNISPKLMYYYVKKAGLTGIKSKVKYSVDESKFDLNEPIFYYYSGLIASDGYIDLKNGRVCLRVGNDGSYEVLNSLKEYFCYEGDVKVYPSGNELIITSKSLIDILAKLNIVGNKLPDAIRYPKNFPNQQCELMFLRGVLDGDGNIHTYKSKYTGKIRGGSFRMSTSCKSLVEGVIKSVNKILGTTYEMTFSSNSSKRKYPQLEMKVEDSKNLYSLIYTGYESFRFLDKYNKYLQIS